MGNYLSDDQSHVQPVQQEPQRPKYEYRPYYSHTDGMHHCGCGSILTKSSIESHLKTIKHQTYAILQDEEREARILRGEFTVRRRLEDAPSHANDSRKKAKPNPPPIPTSISYPPHILEMIVQKEKNCPICYEDLTLKNIAVTSCGHSFCQTCRSQINTCSICRTTLHHAF
jgi:hypothetical protein